MRILVILTQKGIKNYTGDFRAIYKPEISLLLNTEARESGWGTTEKTTQEVFGLHKTFHNRSLEFINKPVRLRSYNTTAIAYIHNMGE